MNDSSLGSKLLQAIHKETLMQTPLPLVAGASEVLGRTQVLVEAQVVDGDRFSHVLGHFGARIKPDAGGASKSSKRDAAAIAQRVVERVGYLPESLQVVEAQPDGSILLRSTPASMRGKGADYFEAQAFEGGFEIKRFAPRPADQGGGRDEKSFCLPDDILARLADDAVGILG